MSISKQCTVDNHFGNEQKAISKDEEFLDFQILWACHRFSKIIFVTLSVLIHKISLYCEVCLEMIHPMLKQLTITYSSMPKLKLINIRAKYS